MSITDIRSAKDRKDLANERAEQMAQVRRQLRVIVLDCPYNTINEPGTQKLLGKIAQFKINAYLDDWKYGVLPLDAGDFIGTHFLVCLETDGDLEILAGFKMMAHDRCRAFGLEFPAFHALTGADNTSPHRQAITALIERADREGHSIGYISSWAVRADAKRSRLLARFCRDLSGTLLLKACQSLGIPYAIGYGVQRLKVDRYHEFLGFKPLTHAGETVPVFTSKSYMNEVLTTALIDAQGFSDEAIRIAAEFEDLWSNRIEIRGVPGTVKKAA